MSEFPIHDKLKASSVEKDAMGRFYDWLNENGYRICEEDRSGRYWPTHKRPAVLIGGCLEIDPDELEQEKQQMLDLCRKSNALTQLQQDIEKMFKELIDKHQLDYYGDALEPGVYQIQEHEVGPYTDVVFDDENMMYLLAGYVAVSIHDDMEENLAKLGYEMIDCDGSCMTLERIPEKK